VVYFTYLLFEFQALDHRCIKQGEWDAATLLDGYFSDGRGRKIMLATLEMDFTVVVCTEEGTNRFLKSSPSLQHDGCCSHSVQKERT
jgi:hypothetical protein